LFIVDAAGVIVGGFGFHGGFSGVEIGVEVSGFIAAVGGGFGVFACGGADAAEADGGVAGAVHDDGIVVAELSEAAEAIFFGLFEGGIEVDGVAFVVLRFLEEGVFGGGAPCGDEGFAEAGV